MYYMDDNGNKKPFQFPRLRSSLMTNNSPQLNITESYILGSISLHKIL
jgi:hypothetical protein